MLKFDRMQLGRIAKEHGFVRDTLEKVCRLVDVLGFLSGDSVLSSAVALKGGTAINLAVLDLPRLSVDIDLDFLLDVERDEMLAVRQTITDHLSKFMASMGYTLSQKSKYYHALDSFVFEYQNMGGMRDNLKVEINYMLRCHVLPPQKLNIELPWDAQSVEVLCVNPIEIFASKITALLTRTAPRDLYDVHNLVTGGFLPEDALTLLRKCIVFYIAIASDISQIDTDFKTVKVLPQHKIRTDLYPVLRRKDRFDLKAVQSQVSDFLSHVLVMTDAEKQFLTDFSANDYRPELLFDDAEIINRIQHHHMALWKCR